MASEASAALADLARRRSPVSAGGLPHNFVELFGGSMVEVTQFQPDPRTYAGEHYYDAKLDQLFRRIVTEVRKDGIIKAIWVPISS